MPILRLACRDLRDATGSFHLLIVCVALGTAAIAVVGLLSAAVLEGIGASARDSIGGDVSLRLFHQPPTAEHLSAFQAAGTVSNVAESRPLARRGGRSTLVELKAVDGHYPLYGTLDLTPALPLDAALARRGGVWGAAVGKALLEKLGATVGEAITIAGQTFEIRATITAEPDRALRAFSLGPRMIISLSAAEAAGLLSPGSQTYWYSRIRLDAGVDAAGWIAGFQRRFPNDGFRIVNAADGVPGVERTLALVTSLSMFVAMGVLLIGAIGIAGSVAAYLDRKRMTIAILRSLGAPPSAVLWLYLIQVLLAGLVGVTAGLLAGWLLAGAITPHLADWLPVAPGFRVVPLAVAGAFGLLVTILFALWPLSKAERMPPQSLFRMPLPHGWQRPKRQRVAAMAGLGALLAALLVAAAPLPVAAAAFAAGATLVCLCLLGLGRLIVIAARLAGRLNLSGRPVLRLALSNTHRPGAPTAMLVMAAGLSLTLLVAVATLRSNAERHLQEILPASAPDMVLLNIEPSDGPRLDRHLNATPNVHRWERAPFLHGQVTHIAGEAVANRRIPREVAFVIRGDRGLSWRAARPPHGITAGQWWPHDYAGPPLLSLDEKVARKLGVTIGDSLTLSVLGEPVEGRIANLRRVDWAGLDLDFPILLSPPAEIPPHREIAALWLQPGAETIVRAALTDTFPMSPAIDMAEVVSFLKNAADGAGQALTAVSLATCAAAFLVLAGAVASGHRRRCRDVAILKMVGASRRQTLGVIMAEFAMIGAAAGMAALVLGWLAAWVGVGDLIAVHPAPGPAALWILTALGIFIAAGFAAGWRAFAHPATTTLRQ